MRSASARSSEHVRRRNLVGEHRQRAFGQDDQAALGARRERGVDRQRLLAIPGIELHVLVDVALHQADGDRVAAGLAPFDRTERNPAQPECHDCRGTRGGGEPPAIFQRSRGIHQQRGRAGDDQADQEHAADRCISGERTAGMCIAAREPGEARVSDAAQPLGCRPRTRGDRQARRRPARRKPHRNPAGQRGEQREIRAKTGRADRGQDRRHAAERAERNVGPRGAGAEKTDAESVA